MDDAMGYMPSGLPTSLAVEGEPLSDHAVLDKDAFVALTRRQPDMTLCLSSRCYIHNFLPYAEMLAQLRLQLIDKVVESLEEQGASSSILMEFLRQAEPFTAKTVHEERKILQNPVLFAYRLAVAHMVIADGARFFVLKDKSVSCPDKMHPDLARILGHIPLSRIYGPSFHP